MRKLFLLLFCCGVIFLTSLIVSLIPLEFVGKKVSDRAIKNNILLTSHGNWTLKLIGLKALISKFEYSFKVEDSKISGHGEGMVYSLLNNSIEIENLVFEIHLAKNDTLSGFIDNVNKKLKTDKYSISVKHFVVNVITANKEDKEVLTDEILFSNVVLKNLPRNKKYQATIGINKDKKTDFLFNYTLLDRNRYEIDAKIKDDDFSCFLYYNNKGGEVSCLAKNLISSLQDVGAEKIKDQFYKKLLNKKLSFKGSINNNKDIVIDGKLKINDDYGKVKMDFSNMNVDIHFENLNFDKTADNYKETLEEKTEEDSLKMEQILEMSGNKSKIEIEAQKKDVLENINSLSKVVNFLLGLTDLVKLKANIKIDNAVVSDIFVKDLNIDASKDKGSKITLNSLNAKFGKEEDLLSDWIRIKYLENQVGNVVISGGDISGMIKLFGLHIFNPELKSKKYYINGDLKLTTNSYSLKDTFLYVDDKKILDFDLLNVYSYETQNNSIESKIIIQNVDLNKYFNIDKIYSDYNNEFLNFQKNEKQDAVFWKKLFEKRIGVGAEEDSKKCVYIFNNVIFGGQQIDNVSFSFEDSKKYTKIEANIISDVINGELNFDLRNVSEKETITSDIKIKNINVNLLEQTNKDIKTSTGENFQEIFLKDEEYNIPSFVGLNGKISAKIDNLIFNDKNIKNISATFLLQDGIFESESFNFNYGDGNVEMNTILSLQGYPEMKVGIACSGIKLYDLIHSPINGYLSLQSEIKFFGFNPYKFFNKFSGKGRFVIQNLSIPHFDLLNTSNNIITNGINSEINYYNIIEKKPLYFSKSEGNLEIDDGVIKGDIKMARELVSGSCEFEFIQETNIIRKFAGSFATMMVRKKLDTPFPIYIPVACNDFVYSPKCLVDWKQFDEVIGNVSIKSQNDLDR